MLLNSFLLLNLFLFLWLLLFTKSEKGTALRDMLTNYDSSVWKTEIALYLDGTSFVHKTNPADQVKAPGSREWKKY